MREANKDTSLLFLAGGGEMGSLIRSRNWEGIVGPIDTWPQSLLMTLALMLNSKFPMFLWWGPELIQFYNDAYRPSLGGNGKHPFALGQKGADCWPEIWPVIKPLIDQVMNGGDSTWSEDQLIPIYRNGRLEDVYWTFSYSPVLDETGNINGVLVVCNETTEKIAAKKRLEDSEGNFRNLVMEAPIATSVFRGPEHVIELANDQALKLWGKDKAIIGKKLRIAIPELVGQPYLQIMDEVYATGTTYEGKENLAYLEIEGQKKPVYVNFIYKALRNGEGETYGVLCMGYNVTEQVLTRKKIAESEERTRIAVESALLGTFDVDMAENSISYSPRLAEIFGVAGQQLTREQIVGLIHPDDIGLRDRANNTLAETGVLNYDARIIWPNQSIRWINAQGKMLLDDNHKPARILGTVRDITTEKEAELALRKSEEKFRHTVEQAPVGIIIMRGQQLVVEMANTTYLEIVDRKKETFVGKPLFDGLPEVRKAVEPIMMNILKTGVPYYGQEFEVPLVRYGRPETAFFNFVYQPLVEPNGEVSGIIAVATEVTQLIRAKHALAESEKQFRNLVLQSPIPMTIFRGKDLVIEMANDAMLQQMWRRELNEVQGRKLLDVFPELRNQQYPELLKMVMETGMAHKEAEAKALVSGPDGIKNFYLDYEYAPLLEPDKSVSGIMATVNDVTSMVEARQQLKEARDRLQLATEGSQVAIWDLDLQTRDIIYSPQLALLFGHSETKQLTHQAMRGQIHPDDLHTIVETAFEAAMQSGIYSYEARVVHPNQSIHWIKTTGKVIFDENHTPMRMLGTMMDITERKQAAESLEKLAAIVQSSDDAIISKRLDGVITSWNAAAERIFGYTEGEMVGETIFKLIPPDRTEEETRIVERLKLGERVEHFETIRIAKGGKKLNVSLTISPVRNHHGQVIGASKIARDITAQRDTERLVKDNEERLQIVIDASELGTWELDVDSSEFSYSKKYAQILGHFGIEKLTHAEFLERMHPDDLSNRQRAFKEAYKTGVMHYVSRLIWPDNSIHWIEAKGKVFYDQQERPLKLIGTARDITDEKLYQQRIEESEKRFKSVADTAPVLIWMAGTDKRYNFFNKAWLNFTGRTMEQELGNGWMQGVHPDDFQRGFDNYLNHFDRREEYYMEYRLKRNDGEYRWISDSGVPRFSSEGVFEGFIGACMDIHDRILFEEKLKESESRLRIAALSSELGTWDYNPVTEVLSWDNASRELFGVDAITPITLDLFWAKMHPEDRKPAFQKMLRALNPDIADTYDAEYRVIGLPDDKIRWIHAKGKVFFDENKNPRLFAGTVLDITDKRVALEELQESEQKFRLLADSMPQFVWTGDGEGNLNYFNKSVYRYSGFTPQQIEEGGWLQIVHPDDRGANTEKWLHSVRTGEPFLFEHRFKRNDGVYRWQLSRAAPQKDAEGNIQMWVGTSTDIHDRKLFTDELESKVLQRTAELHKLNEDLIKSNTELAQFAYVASHDLQEPLRKIQTFATRILDFEEKSLSEKGKDYFSRMQSAAKRMQQLIIDLLSYSRANTDEKHMAVTDLNLLLQIVVEQLKETIDQKQAIVQSVPLPELRVIPYQIEQLLTNIIGNALKFSQPGLKPQINIAAQLVSGHSIQWQGMNQKLNYHHIVISDNGIGFDPQFSERIFQVFQRLHGKGEYEGTGIGLAICKKIVENHHGFIMAASEEGEGASFHIYLPA